MMTFIAATAARLPRMPPKSRINKPRPFGIAGEKEQDIKNLTEQGQQTFMKGSLTHEKGRICKNRSFRGIGGSL